MKAKSMILIGMIFVAIAIANADLGQSAGKLNFGKIPLGENKTLSYWIINTGNESLNFSISADNPNLIISPTSGIIRAKGQQLVNVTAIGNETGNFSGIITAKALQNLTGMVVFNVELQKSYSFEVVEKQKVQLTWILAAMIIFLIFVSVIYYQIKGGKLKWKFGR